MTVASSTIGVPAISAARAAHPVHLHVVRVAVAAGRVVDRQQVGPLLLRTRGEPPAASLDVGVDERVRRPVLGGAAAGEAGVGVAEQHHPGARRGTAADLCSSRIRVSAAALAVRRVGEPALPGGRHHEHHPVALGREHRHGPGRQQRLVVGMGVEEHRSTLTSLHQPSLAGARSMIVRRGPARIPRRVRVCPVRILHVSDCYLPRLGGIEVQVADLVRVQREAGHEVGSPRRPRGDRAGRGPRSSPALPFDLPVHPRGTGRLIRLMADRAPDVVHVHTGAVSPFAWMGVRAARRAGLPAVVTVHSMWDPVTRGALPGAAARPSAGAAGGWWCTAVSEAAARPIRAVAGAAASRCGWCSNGLDVSGVAARPARRRRGGGTAGRCTSSPWAGSPRASSRCGCSSCSSRRAGRSPRRSRCGRRSSATAGAGRDGALPALARPWTGSRSPAASTGSGSRSCSPSRRRVRGPRARASRSAWPRWRPGRPGSRWWPAPRAASPTSSGRGKEGLLGRTFDELASSMARLVRDAACGESIAEHNRGVEPVACSWPAVLEGFDRCYELAMERRRGRARGPPGAAGVTGRCGAGKSARTVGGSRRRTGPGGVRRGGGGRRGCAGRGRGALRGAGALHDPDPFHLGAISSSILDFPDRR